MNNSIKLSTPFESSSFVWIEKPASHRNQFVSFIRSFELFEHAKLTLHLFADTRFRLVVNDQFIAYGPGKFVTQYPDFDSYDLASYLVVGLNSVRVEVNYYGASSYQSMPDGMPGFIAAGGSSELNFNSPGEWQAIVHRSWSPEAPLFSFAQNPAEICDTRLLAEELAEPAWAKIVKLEPKFCPWNVLSERDVPYADYHEMAPCEILVAAPSETERRILGYPSHYPDFDLKRSLHQKKLSLSHQVIAWIYSEQAQSIVFETFWSEVEINGKRIAVDTKSKLGNHGVINVDLQAGWNFYSANFSILTEYWSFLLAWPANAKLSLHARPDLSESSPWGISPTIKDDQSIFPCPSEPLKFCFPDVWAKDSGDIGRICPARQVAWDIPRESLVHKPMAFSQLCGVSKIQAATAIWSFDFKDEYYGHPVIEVEAPAGSTLDIAYDDWKRADGCVNLYNSNPFTDAADRFILKGGRQIIEVLNPRGGIYLQCVLRAPKGSPQATLILHGVTVRSRQILKKSSVIASFKSGDPALDWAWDISIRTIKASTDEGYADCPWRERGSYIGDSLVNIGLNRIVTSDLSIARRTLRIFGEAQHLDGPRQGQLPSVAPAWHLQGHDDFTLLWIVALGEYWSMTGDTEFLRSMWSRIITIWESPVWTENTQGLWDMSTDQSPFIDWGVRSEDLIGESNLLINALRLGAAKVSSQIAAAIGETLASEYFSKMATRVKAAMEKHLWLESEGRFASSKNNVDSLCMHGQVLALAYGAGPAERILSTIEPELDNNFSKGLSKGEKGGHLELYFFYFLLPTLAQHQRTALAEKIIIEHYGYLKSLEYPTLNECFSRASKGNGSCCHSWSGSPAIYASKYLMGLKQRYPGNIVDWELNPQSHGFESIEGSFPHPDGMIEVSWKREDGIIRANVKAPESVKVIPGANVILNL
jgi:alpha-L-rhamnosidase